MIAPVCVSWATVAPASGPSPAWKSAFARPKSATFAWPASFIKIFAALMSRWMRPSACAAAIASAT